MGLKFDVILHGKPISGCHKATDGLDSDLCQNLVNNFFESSAGIKESEILIVDIKYWKDRWYSVYTFWVGDINDTSNRKNCFLAISIVVPDQYLCLVSAVYDLLRRVYHDYIIGNYIVNGKYNVKNFDDADTFKSLHDLIDDGFVNLGENLEESFNRNPDRTRNILYSLFDCDSRAFVEDLKKFGRIFVSEKYESKDQLFAEAGEYRNKFEQAQKNLKAKELENGHLKEDLENLNRNLDEKAAQASSQKASMDEKLNGFKQENDKLKSEIEKLRKDYEKIKNGIRELLGTEEKAQSNQIHKNKTTAALNVSVKGVISILNTLLLIILFMVFCVKSCVSGTDYDAYTKSVEKLEQKLDGLINAQKTDKQMEDNADDENNTDTDIDCYLEFYQNNTPVDPDKIDIKSPLVIKVKKPIDGYEFYASNLNVAKIVSGEPFKLTKKDPNGSITISYRSDEEKNVNKANVVVIK